MGQGQDDERLALGLQAAAVLAYLQRRVPGEELAMTLFRQTMLRAWARIDRFPVKGRRRQLIWLLALAAKALAESSDGRGDDQAAADGSDGVVSQVPTRGVFTADVQLVRSAMSRLRYHQREMVALVHGDGLTPVEAAAVLGLTASGAMGEYGAARANLRAVLEGARI